MEALNDAYYRELKGSVGARAFHEWFKRNNARQRKSLEDKGKETGKKRKVPKQFRKDMEERRRKRERETTSAVSTPIHSPQTTVCDSTRIFE
jgi:hypothetical protein